MTAVNEYLLDEPDEIEAADPGGMVREVAAAPALFRAAMTAAY